MKWDTVSSTWPNADCSRFVRVGGTRFHLQQIAHQNENAPAVLLIHGSGATTHSYADLLPLLAKSFSVTAIDLPGHGLSSMLGQERPSLPAVSAAVRALCLHERITPKLIVGHSAGGAVSAQMASDGVEGLQGLVVINGSFYPFRGIAQHIFPAAAKLLFYNPFMPRFFAATARDPKRISKLIASTGSRLSPEQLGYYQTAFQSRDHVEGTLEMMANWDLSAMPETLSALELPILQIVGGQDGTVKPSQAKQTATFLKHGELALFEPYGHLVHEEIPEQVADTIYAFVTKHGIV